jgi:hypothetical protein
MTEGLFILTTIFVAYVVYVIVNEPKTAATAEGAKAKPAAQPIPEVAVKPAAVVAQPVVAKVASPAPSQPAVVAKTAPKATAKPAPKAELKPASKAEPKVAAKAEAKASPKPAPKPKAAAKPSAPAPAAIAASTGLKDPVSGEVSSSYGNYRFTKRWIKDALVAEGLLPKVYKNTELDATVESQIKAAIAKLEAIDKYKA